MKPYFLSGIMLACLSSLSGCASVVGGVNQSISIETPPAEGASCSLQNDKGKWFVNKTPGAVTVHRSYKDLEVTCHAKGYDTVEKKVKSTTKSMAFGNILFGGGIGAGVDVASGAAYDYPENISVPMLIEQT